jgi:hypothetical protein
MKGTLANITRALVAGLTLAAAAACSDAGSSPVTADGAGPRLLTAGGYQLLSSSTTLTPSAGLNAVSYTVTMPSTGPIYLSFYGRINWPSTAGNSNVLEVLVNGVAVTSSHKSWPTSYSYANQGGYTEPYYDNRGSGWGQPTSLWGLFWSPDLNANNNSSNTYYVSHGNAYSYDFDITSLVNLGGSNTITLTNRGGWVTSATGNTPSAVLQNITLRNY